ncbi:MAG: WecB/TagA/CpsF family glycosyltransferase [Pseudomonadota bacterium]
MPVGMAFGCSATLVLSVKYEANFVASPESVIVGGFEVSRLSRSELTDVVSGKTTSETAPLRSEAKLLFSLNGHALALSRQHDGYRRSLEDADIIHVDGEPLVIASRWLTKTPVRERSATTDLFHDISEAAERKGLSIYLLGATPQIVAECVSEVKRLYPGLKIAGYRDGYFTEDEEAAVVDQINAAEPDIVWVGMGKPREQLFSSRNRARLKCQWVITCGGCFNFVTGAYQRAPEPLQKAGLEWLHRMVTRPRQMFWRYLTTNPVAVFMLLRNTRAVRMDN